MKYRIINNKGYNIFQGRFEILPGESEIECSVEEAKILGSTNGLIVEKIIKIKTPKVPTGEDINLLKK
jgi:hypothetical protein